MTNTPGYKRHAAAAFSNRGCATCGGGWTLWGSADGVWFATEVITHRLGEFGMDDIWVLLPLVLFDPHLEHVSV